MSIADNVKSVKERIKTASIKSGRKADDILLVGVSKTVAVPEIKEAVSAGIADLGENKPQELRDKFPQINGVKWHMIGHLQTNKVKYVIDKAVLIHSVDSEKLLDEINKHAEKIEKIQDVLIQINVSKEESKSGIYADELPKMLEYASTLNNISVKGLMSIPPAFYNNDELKYFFETCNKIFIDNKGKTYHNIDMKYLSMGMTHDFELAIEMGSNIVRVGTGIFGARNYN